MFHSPILVYEERLKKQRLKELKKAQKNETTINPNPSNPISKSDS